jgi:hypothetical protein
MEYDEQAAARSAVSSPSKPASGSRGRGWRAASVAALLLAILSIFALFEWRATDLHGDYVTGFAVTLVLFGALVGASGAGVLCGLLEVLRPSEERDRWSGLALWANVLFAMIAVALFVL